MIYVCCNRSQPAIVRFGFYILGVLVGDADLNGWAAGSACQLFGLVIKQLLMKNAMRNGMQHRYFVRKQTDPPTAVIHCRIPAMEDVE